MKKIGLEHVDSILKSVKTCPNCNGMLILKSTRKIECEFCHFILRVSGRYDDAILLLLMLQGGIILGLLLSILMMLSFVTWS